MVYPTINNRVTSEFGWRRLLNNDDYHSGTDYGCLDNKNPTHDDIFAIADGIVRVAKNNVGGYGLYVVIEHDGYCSLYAHLYDMEVQVGDKVKEGEVIGYMGSTGSALGIHLHFEIRDCNYEKFWERWNNREPRHAVDPVRFFLENMTDGTSVNLELVAENARLKQIIDDINKLTER